MKNKTPIKIAIIEDQEDNIEILQMMLAQFPQATHVAHIGRDQVEALDILSQQDFDLALLDIQLGDGTIFDVFTKIKDKGNLASKLIFVTAHGTFENALKAIRLSCLDFITKPIDYEELESAINKIISPTPIVKAENQISMLMQLLQQDVATPGHIGIPLSKGLIEFVETECISHITADTNMSIIHLKDKQKLRSTKNLGHYISVLNTHHHFFQIHKSTLINMAYIKKFDPRERFVFLKDGTALPVARRQSMILRERLLRF